MSRLAKFSIGLGLCVALLFAASEFLRWPTTTVSDIELLRETEQFTLVRHDGQSGRMYKSFVDDFSEPQFLSWFGEDRWTTIDTLSPSSPSLEEYVSLRNKIFRGESDFLDNRIEAGDGVAKFTAVAPTPQMVTSKSMLENNRLWFVKGDHLWYRGKYLLKKGVPFTIADFQERGRYNSPGPRITIWDKKYLGYELKSGWKPKRRQTEFEIPIDTWFVLTVHLLLDESDGLVEIWQDDDLVLSENVATLAASDSLLNALEVGITATDEAAEVWVDEVAISHARLR
ncbi:hypothetical protein Pla22_35930 [Rubripirellula amarantea]|uniref:Uncharacterized protein n=1 Tax=Rubripirellula amarantea TaxID=2527999 RepID=A0A5C5WJM1_9BACT|nr:membrane or secreted protein [Rubripirellula amarantea]TWT50850.1 hypothetical protein Pla22_35930 [Rubripirellula amarantea]